MNKAYLVEFSPRTRVIADRSKFKTEDDFLDYLEKVARKKMMDGIEDYLSMENGSVEEDTECPYGSFSSDYD